MLVVDKLQRCLCCNPCCSGVDVLSCFASELSIVVCDESGLWCLLFLVYFNVMCFDFMGVCLLLG